MVKECNGGKYKWWMVKNMLNKCYDTVNARFTGGLLQLLFTFFG